MTTNDIGFSVIRSLNISNSAERSAIESKGVRYGLRLFSRNPKMSTTIRWQELRSIMCKKWWPYPLPRCAPSIKPGRSATAILRPSIYSTVPIRVGNLLFAQCEVANQNTDASITLHILVNWFKLCEGYFEPWSYVWPNGSEGLSRNLRHGVGNGA